MGYMKKILYVLMAVALVGCTDSGTQPGFKRTTYEYGASGFVQHGFLSAPMSGTKVQMGNREAPDYWIVDWSEYVPVDSVTGAYKIDTKLSSGLVEFSVSASDFVNPFDHNVVYNMELTAAADLEKDSVVNVNYLTSLAAEMTWSYMERGAGFEEARNKANSAILAALHMPKELVNFDKYSLYGEGEGDAMLAAISIVIERYYLDYSMTTAWETLEINPETGKFVSPEAFRRLAAFANGIISDDGGKSYREKIEAKAPKGKVGHFEKYLTMLAVSDGGPECTKSNEGEMRDLGENYTFSAFKVQVCSDSAWRPATKDDFDVEDIFNPDVEYGTMTDPRDGRTYKTLDIGGHIWMAENLKYADSAASENLKGQSWCYDNDESNCDVFGRLYTWSAAMDLEPVYLDSVADLTDGWRGICPEGWHVPEREFGKLDGNTTFASAFMALGTNEGGFSVIPAGYGVAEYEYDDDGAYVFLGMSFERMGESTFLWTSDQQPWGGTRSMYLKKDRLSNEPESRHNAGYLRCVKDYSEED